MTDSSPSLSWLIPTSQSALVQRSSSEEGQGKSILLLALQQKPRDLGSPVLGMQRGEGNPAQGRGMDGLHRAISSWMGATQFDDLNCVCDRRQGQREGGAVTDGPDSVAHMAGTKLLLAEQQRHPQRS